MPRALALLTAAALASLAPSALAQADCAGFWVAPSGEISAPAGRGGTQVVVYAPAGCSFTVSTTAEWLSTYPDAFTTAASETAVEVFWEDSAGTARSGSVAIAAASGETQFLTVRQAAECAFSVDSSYFTFSRGGGSGHFVVGADDSCAWSVLASYWISVDGSQRFGTSTIEFTVQENLDDLGRSGGLTVGRVEPGDVVGAVSVTVEQSATDEAPAPTGEDAHSEGEGGIIEKWVADSIVESPGPAVPVALAALAAVALLARGGRRSRRD